MPTQWKTFNDSVVSEIHGPLHFYRDLYEGNHSKLFSRAQDLIEKGEITDRVINGPEKATNVRVPYIVANVSKIIPEITATFVSRSIGKAISNYQPDAEQIANATDATDNLMDGTNDSTINGTILDLQNELIDGITKASKLNVAQHWSNVVQQQVDGGLVGVPWMDENGISIEFKARDMYFPHTDGDGADLVYTYAYEDESGDITEYLHVYREEVRDGNLYTRHFLRTMDSSGQTKEVDEDTTKLVLKMDVLENVYVGRSEPFIQYWANEKTFMKPLGVSCLQGQESKQDEINWTLTRNAIVYERNGKPRLAISEAVMRELQNLAVERYGDARKIDSRDLEVTTFGADGKTIEVIQIDISKIGTYENVKNYIKLMLMETQTSEKAVDFYLDGGASGAQSGVAKFYDLLLTILKSERVQEEYIAFLKGLYQSALWLANDGGKEVIIEEPEFEVKDMIPITKTEIAKNEYDFKTINIALYKEKAQSLETTIRNINPGKEETWYEEEMLRLEMEKASSDTMTLGGMANTVSSFMDNRNADGSVIATEADPTAPVKVE